MELFKIFGTVAINGAAAAERELKDLSEKATSGAERIKTGFANIGKVAKTLAVTAGAAFAAVGGAIVGLAEGTREYRIAMGKLTTAFADVGLSAETGMKTFQDFYAVLGDQDQATEAVSNLVMLTQDQRALSEWTTIAAGVYAKFGAALPIENLTEAANETARTGQLTGGLADALNWAGVNEEAFQAQLDACTTTQEREALIRATLNGLYAEAGEQYREVNADIIAANEAQARMTDAMAVLGEKAEPILTAVKNGFASVVERASAFLAEVDMQAITDAISNAFSWFIDTAIPAIQTGVQWVIDNKDVIVAIISAIGAGFLAWNIVQIVSGAITVLSSLKATLDLVRTGQLALNAAMKANIIGIIITIVVALVTAFISLWNNCEGFRNFWINLWEDIKAAAAAAGAWIAATVADIGQDFVAVGEDIAAAFTVFVAWLGDVAASIGQFFADAWEDVKGAWSAAVGWFSGVYNGIKSTFANVGAWFGSKFTAAWGHIKSAWGSVTGWFRGIWNTITGIFGGVIPIPKIKMPKFSITPSGWKIGDLLDGVIPKLGITWNARGGVFDKPTIMQGVGEDGAEAVVPLEKNLGWLDKLSGMLCERIVPGGSAGAANYNSALDTMQQTLVALLDKLDNMQLVLDTGAVVGGIATAMDAELGNLRVRKGRAQ